MLSILSSKKKTQAHLVPCSTSQMDTHSVSRGMVWWFMGERDAMVQVLWTETYLTRQERKGES